MNMEEKLTPEDINEVLDALEVVRVAWGRLVDATDNKPDDLLCYACPVGEGDIREAYSGLDRWVDSTVGELCPIPTDNHTSPKYGARVAQMLNDGIRVQLLRWLQWCDPNGSYLDGSNGPTVTPMTLAEARAMVCDAVKDDVDPPELLAAVRKYADPTVAQTGGRETYAAFRPGAAERARLAEAEASVKAARAAVEAAEVVRQNAERAVKDATSDGGGYTGQRWQELRKAADDGAKVKP